MVWFGACKTTNSMGSGIKPLGYGEEKSVLKVFQGKSLAWLYTLLAPCKILAMNLGHRCSSETSHAHGVMEKLNATS